jgi:hypothetical protein
MRRALRRVSNTGLRSLLVAALLAALLVPTATANVGAAASRPAPKALVKKLRALKKQTAALVRRVAALEAAAPVPGQRGPAGASGPPGPAGPVGPPGPAGSLNGPAGGALTGAFPDPGLAEGVVASANIVDGTITSDDVGLNALTSANIADEGIQGADIALGGILSGNLATGAVTSSAIADGSITQPDLGLGSVGAPQLRGLFVKEGDRNVIGGSASGSSGAFCPAGSRLITGGWEWETPAPDLGIVFSKPIPDRNLWEVLGRNNSGAENALIAQAVCLSG